MKKIILLLTFSFTIFGATAKFKLLDENPYNSTFFDKSDTILTLIRQSGCCAGGCEYKKQICSMSGISNSNYPFRGYNRFNIWICDDVEKDTACDLTTYYGFHTLAFITMYFPDTIDNIEIFYDITRTEFPKGISEYDNWMLYGWHYDVIACSIKVVMEESSDTIMHHPVYYYSGAMKESFLIARSDTSYKWRGRENEYTFGPFVDTLVRIDDATNIVHRQKISIHREIFEDFYDALGRQIIFRPQTPYDRIKILFREAQ